MKERHPGCPQCEAMMIQGVFCHETGCPNTHKMRVPDSGGRFDSEWTMPDELDDEEYDDDPLIMCEECGQDIIQSTANWHDSEDGWRVPLCMVCDLQYQTANDPDD
jgi:hypothetical protein